MFSAKAFGLAALLLVNTPFQITAWKFATNGFDALADNIDVHAIQLMEDTRHLTGDSGGAKLDQIVMGNWEDDWVQALGFSDLDFISDIGMSGNDTLITRQTPACGIPACNDPNAGTNDELQSAALNLRVTQAVCQAVKWGALPAGTTYIGVRATGLLCGAAASQRCSFTVGLAVAVIGQSFGLVTEPQCEKLVNRAGEYCETVGGTKTCQVADGEGGSFSVSVKTTVTDAAGAVNCPGAPGGGQKTCKEIDFNA